MRLSLLTSTVLFPLLALAEDEHPSISTTRTLTSTLTRTTTISTTASVTTTLSASSTIVSAYPTMYPSNSTAPMGTATAPYNIPSGGMATTTAKSDPTSKPAPTNFPGSGAETLERNKIVMGAAALMAIVWMF